MNGRNNEQRFCWEQIHRTNRLFRVSHLFASPHMSNQLLALHALFASIELLNGEISEELVAQKKLDWWRTELLQHDAGDSQHPVVRQLHASGAVRKLPGSLIAGLLDSAERRFDALAPADENDLLRLCKEIYLPQVLLESALGDVEVTPGSYKHAMLSNGGLIQLLRQGVRRIENAFWWIPLSLLARYKINRRELNSLSDSDGLRALFNHVLIPTGRSANT